MFNLSDYYYDLPQELIAQKPITTRDASRLLSLDRKTGAIAHYSFSDIVNLLHPTDVLVINNTKVIPGRLFGKKDTGGKVEVLILNVGYHQTDQQYIIFECLVKSSKPPKPKSFLLFDENVTAQVLSRHDNIWTLKFSFPEDFETVLNRIGHIPLPPYIKRCETDEDRSSYQTVYASQIGAIAAPTAGFHFTKNLIETLQSIGIKFVEITLHVGYGTFLPVRVTDIRNHQMHSEWFQISDESADQINRAKADHKRIVAVGTTSVRTLEYVAAPDGKISSGKGFCDLFIYPGYKFKIVDAMITNFHLPESTLLMLVSAFAGRENILTAYQHAIAHKYRFYSYGDAMYIY